MKSFLRHFVSPFSCTTLPLTSKIVLDRVSDEVGCIRAHCHLEGKEDTLADLVNGKSSRKLNSALRANQILVSRVYV